MRTIETNSVLTACLLISILSGCGGGSSSGPSGTPPPVSSSPTFTSVAPSSGFAGGGTPLTIVGTNFRSGVAVTIGGAPVTSISLTGSTGISVTAPAHATGAADIVIKNSDTTTITAAGAYTYLGNPVPTIASATPNSIVAGSSSTSIGVSGTGYTAQSTIQLDGTPLSSQFVSATQLTATLTANLIAYAGMGRLTASNPSPGGGSSDSGPAFSIGPTSPVAAYGQTATALQDGRVLICGGLNGATALNSATIYNPTTNTISAAGPMTSPRYGHTATLLSSGKVLIAGGTDENTGASLSTAEIFDPGSGTFAATSPMVNHREFHTATILPNGKVLLAGSYITADGQSAETFDPNTNTFSSAPQMTTIRAEHSAIALSDGTVLIMGGIVPCAVNTGNGFCDDLHLSSAEIYSLTSNTFIATGSMHVGRRLASAVLLKNEKALVIGGADELGTGPEVATTQAETYDPSTKQFSVIASSNVGFWNGTAVLLADGRVLVCGGHDESSSFGYSQIFDPTSLTFTVIPAMNTPRLGASAALLASGSVVVFGGSSDASTGLNSTEIFSPSSLSSEFLLQVQNPLPSLAQLTPATTVAGDTATLSGTGFDSQSEVLVNGESVPYTLASAQQIQFPMPAVYGTYSIAVSNPAPGGGLSNALQQTSHVSLSVDPQTPQVLPGSATPLTVTVLGGGTYTSSVREGAAGGSLTPGNDGHWFAPAYIAPSTLGTYHVDYVSSVEPQATATATITVSNSATNATSISLQAPHAAGLAATTLASGKILIAGGGTGTVSTSNAAEVLDPSAGSSKLVASMTLARSGHTATLLASGLVLIAGGITPNAGGVTSPTVSTEIFDPSASTFSVGPSLNTARNGHFALLLPSGDILIAGGCTAASALSTEIYRASTKTIQAGPTLIGPHCGGRTTTLSTGQILFTGGFDPSTSVFTGAAEIYDPTTNALSSAGTLMQARYSHTATLLPDGRVLVAGGYSATAGTLATTEYFSPVSKSFSEGPALDQPRQDHAATELSSGSLFIAGGQKLIGPFGISIDDLETLGSSFSETALLTPRVDPILLNVGSASFMLIGGEIQTADLVTVNTPVPASPAPSVSSCYTESSSYISCYTYDLQTPIKVIIDGVTYSTLPYTSDSFQLGIYPNILTSGSHTVQVQNPDGKLSNVLPFTF